MTTIYELIERVRRDLGDTDAQTQRWSDAQLMRHVEHAVREYSRAAPQEVRSTVATVSGSREVSISSLTPLVRVVRVEFPVDQFPPVYAAHSVWGTTIVLHTDALPNGDNCYVYWHQGHAVDGDSSSIPEHHEEIVVAGAVSYAAQERAAAASNQVNVDPQAVQHFEAVAARWGDRFDRWLTELMAETLARQGQQFAVPVPAAGEYSFLAAAKRQEFELGLRDVRRKLRSGQLWTVPGALGRDQSRDWGP